MSNLVRLYTQNNCPYCVMMKDKLDSWGMNYQIINVSEDLKAKTFLKEQGHRTVPQLYYRNTHLNKVDTVDFTKEVFWGEMRLAYDQENDSGVEMFG